MKRYISAAFAAAALFTVTGCEGGNTEPTQVSTSDPSAGITSNYTSQSLQADISTTSTEAVIEVVATETVFTETETTSAVSAAVSGGTTETAAVAVSGGGSNTSAAKPAVTTKPSGGGQAADTTSSSAVQPVQTTTTSSSTSVVPDTTTRPAPTHDEIVDAYINEVSKRIDMLLEDSQDSVYVFYTLYDMDGNGIPELIIKSGTDEETYQDSYYICDEFGIKVVSAGNDGSHSVFAYDPDEGQFVTAYSYMGSGSLNWLEYDGSDIQSVKDTAFEYNSDDTFEAQMSRYGVERLPFAMYTYSGEELTWVYRVVNGGLEYDEIEGRDFSFIYNYEF